MQRIYPPNHLLTRLYLTRHGGVMTGSLLLENQTNDQYSPVTKQQVDQTLATHRTTVPNLTTGILTSIRNYSVRFGKLQYLGAGQQDINATIANAILLTGTTTVTGSLLYNTVPTLTNEVTNKLYGIGLKNNASAVVTGDLKIRHGEKSYTDYLKCRGQLALKSAYPQLATKLGATYNVPISVIRDSRNITVIGCGEPHRHQFEFNSFEFLRNVETVGTIPVPFVLGCLIPVHKYIYHIGGTTQFDGANNPSSVNSIYRAEILPDGELSSFTLYGTLPVSLRDMSFAIYKNMIYLMGGAINGTYTRNLSIYVSAIGADGSIGAFTEHSKKFPAGFIGAATYVTKNRIYVIGGVHHNWLSTTDTPYGTNCYELLFDANESLSTISPAALLDHTVCGASVSVMGNNVLLTGGSVQYKDTTGTVRTKVVRTYKLATLQADGSLSKFASTNYPLPNELHYHASVSTSKYTILAGGTSLTDASVDNAILFLQNTDSGVPLPPRKINLTLPHPLAFHHLFVVGDYLYVIGGNKLWNTRSDNLNIYRYQMVGNRTPVYNFKAFQDGREMLVDATFQITNDERDLTAYFTLPIFHHSDSGGKFSYYIKT